MIQNQNPSDQGLSPDITQKLLAKNDKHFNRLRYMASLLKDGNGRHNGFSMNKPLERLTKKYHQAFTSSQNGKRIYKA